MAYLVVNAGSTTIKFKLFNDRLDELLSGMLDQKHDKTVFKLAKKGEKFEWEISAEEFRKAPELILKELDGAKLSKIGFRVVHGGESFKQTTKITDKVLDSIDNLSDLAPLHNPPAVKVIIGFRKLIPDTPMYAVFDTAFHTTLPEKAFLYAVPYELYTDHQLRRYGFHGTSHKYVSTRLRELEADPEKIISCHLGGGASICAIQDGKSVDTSMGFTPLEGLVMATRSGDIDPGAVLYLERMLNQNAKQIDELLNKKSGLLGLSEKTSDMRALLEEEEKGDPASSRAVQIYTYRIQKYIGAYAAAMGGIDALIFTAGVGQGSDVIRDRVCEGLEFLGIEVNNKVNDGRYNVNEELKISSNDSIPVWVIPTNEELQIAREVTALD